MMSKFFLASLTILGMLILQIQSHPQRIIQTQAITMHLAINQPGLIQPKHEGYNKIFYAKTKLPEDQQYLNVNSAKVLFIPLQQLSLPRLKHQSVFEDLRSKQNSQFQHIQIFETYYIVFERPNKILKIDFQDQKVKSTHTEYKIQQLHKNSQTKFYKLNQTTGLLIAEKQNSLFVIRQSNYSYIKYHRQFSFAHLQVIDDEHFMTAEYAQGVRIYHLDAAKQILQEKVHIDCQDFIINKDNQKKCSIKDLSYENIDKKLHILDYYSGVSLFQLEQEITTDGLINNFRVSPDHQPQIIVQLTGCQIMDFISRDHFVLVCKDPQSLRSYIQQVIQMEDKINKNTTFVKRDPMFHPCNFEDIIVTDQYYIAYNRYSFDIFWNSVSHGLYSTQLAKTSDMKSLQAFKFERKNNDIFLHTILGNVLQKWMILSTNGHLQIVSNHKLQKSITVLIDGPCPQIITNKKQLKNQEIEGHSHPKATLNKQYPIEQCVFEQNIFLKVSEKVMKKQVLSISLGLIILMLLILAIIVCICFNKYDSLEAHMRKMVKQYKRKSKKDFKPINY